MRKIKEKGIKEKIKKKKWNWQKCFPSPHGSIGDSPKDNQRKRKKENESKKNGTGMCIYFTSPRGSTGDSPQKPCSQRHTQSASLSS